MGSKTKEQKVTVNVYLRTSELSDPLKKMMMDLYQGEIHTLKEWKEIDDKTNKRRC